MSMRLTDMLTEAARDQQIRTDVKVSQCSTVTAQFMLNLKTIRITTVDIAITIGLMSHYESY